MVKKVNLKRTLIQKRHWCFIKWNSVILIFIFKFVLRSKAKMSESDKKVTNFDEIYSHHTAILNSIDEI